MATDGNSRTRINMWAAESTKPDDKRRHKLRLFKNRAVPRRLRILPVVIRVGWVGGRSGHGCLGGGELGTTDEQGFREATPFPIDRHRLVRLTKFKPETYLISSLRSSNWSALKEEALRTLLITKLCNNNIHKM